ncbi:type II toxin-antitoxin system HipA family toxin [Solimonas sp. K1W22B-7]|uniref:type II toxin-antitoxin system HipA family toxin n=1 Tax=Solimonas sp. K1W22B-7 TaxID=2303331 RepID=UPI000E330926|nr:type II toxin-antitoxin system HipA family toxin [Solimonas sp. K1W22B-7]AXQ27485.1 type II toxin-antitoxin system HipA family toxin [Solimonas sp. K1W22B-7]
MARPSSSRALAVWMNGERVGTWTTRAGRPDEFGYASEWLAAGAARPLSLSMPLGPGGYKGEAVSAFFDNLLPDSRGIRERIQRRFGASSTGAFDLLAEIGRDCVGAIQLLPEGSAAPDVRKIEGTPLTARQVDGLLADMLGAPIGRAGGDEGFRISLAGAQEKTALLRQGGKWLRPRGITPTTHILKLPIGLGGGGIDLTTSVENEWLCTEIFKAYGLPAANCWMDRFGERKLLVVERFDRRLSQDGRWIVRLPQEDLCQATGVPADSKYESDGGPGILRIMDLLLGSSHSAADRRRFLKTQMLFWMLCAIDGHAKNFSLFLEAGGGYRLTPLYDVLSAHPVLGNSRGQLPPRKVKMAMAVEGTSRHYLWHTIQPRHWEETARRAGMAAAYPEFRAELIEATPAVVEKLAAQLPKGFPQAVAGPIFKGLRAASEMLARG